ncbi:MAG: hypothetical protein GEU78_08925 [Actinobacteria bacterium]|nr:hypothetical protein [Actinomycetota bacterium]
MPRLLVEGLDQQDVRRLLDAVVVWPLEQLHLSGERDDHLFDARRELFDSLIDVVDVRQDVADHEAMVLGDEVFLVAIAT